MQLNGRNDMESRHAYRIETRSCCCDSQAAFDTVTVTPFPLEQVAVHCRGKDNGAYATNGSRLCFELGQ